jgi:hypothetical protein
MFYFGSCTLMPEYIGTWLKWPFIVATKCVFRQGYLKRVKWCDQIALLICESSYGNKQPTEFCEFPLIYEGGV